MRRKHVLFIVENSQIPKDPRVWSEARAAKEYGYDVTVICSSEGMYFKRQNIDGIDIYAHPRTKDLPNKLPMLLEYLNAVIWELLLSAYVFIKNRFHVIHAANPPDHLFIIALLFRPFGVKFIFDHHDIAPENYVAKFGKKDILYKSLLLMEKMTFRFANVVISTNESYKKIAIERGGKEERDVFVVRNGPNTERIKRVHANPDLRKGYKYLVGYVGVIAQQEGIDHLLNIARYLINDKGRKDIKFIIVGRALIGNKW